MAREICQRLGIKALLTGSIASLGSHYVVTLAALNGSSGDALAREQVEVDSKEQVLKSLDKAASSLRQKMGESLASVQQFAKPLEEATTSSLEALQAFTLGRSEHLKARDDAAIPHLKQAIELDPNFATAYAMLGVAYFNLGQTAEGMPVLKKAYGLRDRASERERFYIEAHYYDEVTIDQEKAIAVYRSGRRRIPATQLLTATQRWRLPHWAGTKSHSNLPAKDIASIRTIRTLTTKWQAPTRR
jgi:tetratricopeptide (TPR) repeat protein